MFIKNTLIVLLGASGICLSSQLMSQDVPPPGGPYQSAQLHRFMQQQQNAPEWVKSRRQEMDKLHMELSNRNNSSKESSQMVAPWWVKREIESNNRPAPIEQQDKSMSAGNKPMHPAWAQQPAMRMPAPPANPYYRQHQNSQPLSSQRGQYVPNVPPANYYARPVNPGVQMQRPMNNYPPMWR